MYLCPEKRNIVDEISVLNEIIKFIFDKWELRKLFF